MIRHQWRGFNRKGNLMKHYLALTLLCLPMVSLANDSTGFVGTGGIQYLKSPHIAMQTEDFFISKTQVACFNVKNWYHLWLFGIKIVLQWV